MNENSNAVVAGLCGGLGNQMFQYAAARALSLRLNAPLKLDISWFIGRTDRQYALDNFAIFGETCTRAPLVPNFLKRLESKLSRRLARKRMGVPIQRESHFHFNPAFDDIKQPVYLEGYWQSERYFNSYRREISNNFSLASPPPEKCNQMLAQIQSTESICVHVRRGDYIFNPATAKVHAMCSVDYYQKGVAALVQALNHPHCYIFSDDLDWARRSLAFPCPLTIVDINKGEDAHWDFFLMKACSHFVIANSSMSWWAAWLGETSDKRVISPAKWFNIQEKNTKDLIPNGWERI